ncbi:MAG: nuclear transport factor 2 family protein [Gammaproteobacteria bacterium]|nr:nuclear transport factor 2 family protein [Gammaproteobacteria bacterium]
MSTVPDIESNKLILNLKRHFEEFSVDSLSGLDAIYTQDIEFLDPVHKVEGILYLKHYLNKMAENLTHYKIRYTDQLVGENTAFLTWEMEYANSKLRGGQIITIRGMSHLKFTKRIYYHEDCYDLGALVYEHLPLLGGITRSLKSRLAAQGN